MNIEKLRAVIKNADIEELLKGLYSFDDFERDLIAGELQRRKDGRAIKPLVDLYVDPKRQQLPDSDGDFSTTIPQAIISFGPPAVPELVKHLDFGPIFWVIGAIGDPSATSYLVDRLEYAPSDHFYPILGALAGCGDKSIIPVLEQFKQRPGLSSMIREVVSDVIQEISEKG